MTGCRNCEQLTSGDCGRHGQMVFEVGPPRAIVPCPGCGYAGSGAHICPPSPGTIDTGAIHRAPLEAEVARLTAELDKACKEVNEWWRHAGTWKERYEAATAELAAEREARAEAEAREGRLRLAGRHAYESACILAGGSLPSSSEGDEIRSLGRTVEEPADDSALRAHVAAAVERVVAAARQARDGVYAPHGTPPGAIMQAVQYASASDVLAAVEAAAKKETT